MKGYFRKRGTKWSFTVDVGKDESTGKRKQITRGGFSTKKEAEKECAELIAQYEQGIDPNSGDMTYAEYLKMWLDVFAKPNYRPSTYENHLITIEKRIIPVLGHIPLNKITAIHITKFINELKPKYSADYVKTIFNILRKTFRQAKKWDILMKNVIENVEAPKVPKQKKTTWTPEEAVRFLEAAKGDRFEVAYFMAIYTGMRRGEVLGQAWSDIDLNEGMLRVSRTVYRTKSQGLIFQEPKTENSKRKFAIAHDLVEILKKHKRQQNEIKMVQRRVYQDHDLVICHMDGTPHDPRFLLKCFDKVIDAAKVPKIRFHDLRHTFATMLLGSGEDPKKVSEMLGHYTVAFTMDTYYDVLPENTKSVAGKMNDLLNTARKTVDK